MISDLQQGTLSLVTSPTATQSRPLDTEIYVITGCSLGFINRQFGNHCTMLTLNRRQVRERHDVGNQCTKCTWKLWWWWSLSVQGLFFVKKATVHSSPSLTVFAPLCESLYATPYRICRFVNLMYCTPYCTYSIVCLFDGHWGNRWWTVGNFSNQGTCLGKSQSACRLIIRLLEIYLKKKMLDKKKC